MKKLTLCLKNLKFISQQNQKHLPPPPLFLISTKIIALKYLEKSKT